MKRSAQAALIALTLSALAVPAFADSDVHYPSNDSTPSASYQHGKSRAEVKAELATAMKDGSIKHLDRTVYVGN